MMDEKKRLSELALRAVYTGRPQFTRFLEPSMERDALAAAREAYAQGKQVALVLMNTPYGAQHLPKEYDIVCSYSHTPAAVAAAIDVLTGRAQPMGTLPVTLD